MTSPRTGLQVTTPNDLDIVMMREFNAPRALVFDAWTNCDHLTRWLGREGETMSVCEVDLRVGGGYRYLWQLREGGEMGMYGAYLEIESPARLVSTENFDGEWFEPMGGGTVNTMVLEERDGRTTMTITCHYKSREARDGVLQFPWAEGAEESMQRLDALLKELTQS